jgi:hypothetical protein
MNGNMKRILILITLACIGCAPVIPLSETIVFPEQRLSDGITGAVSVNGGFTNESATHYAKKKYAETELYNIKYLNSLPSAAVSLGYSNDDFGLAASLGYMVLQADMSFKLGDKNYLTVLAAMNQSYKMILERRVHENLALGGYFGSIVYDAVESDFIFPKINKDKSIRFSSYGLHALWSISNHSTRLQGFISAGYSYNIKTPVLMGGILLTGVPKRFRPSHLR